jgi:glucosamine-6-phosphate deaminase
MRPSKTFSVDALSVRVYDSEIELAEGAAQMGQEYLQAILAEKATAAAILATGNSQIQFLEALTILGGVDWSRLSLFHLDEYLGIEADSPASFRYYLRERVEKQVKPAQFHYIQGDALEPLAECDRYTKLLIAQPIELCLLGVGQNGHLAFNEPEVANFHDSHRVKLVKLARQTRIAQVHQGYFPHLEAVPQYAFTLTIPMLASAQKLICLAPGLGKAPIIKKMLTEAISPACPASVLRQYANATLFLDKHSASLL